MLIIDKYKDFYDHYSHIYGIDKKVTFDRRGSSPLTDGGIISYIGGLYSTHGFLVLEVGYVQYLIEVYDIVYIRTGIAGKELDSFNFSLKKVYKEDKHYGKTPMSIYEVFLEHDYNWKSPTTYIISDKYANTVRSTAKGINLPIIKETFLTKILDGDIIWKDLQNYISSLNNDKDIDLKMTDKEKAETHGFDKYSFRHPIK